MSEIRSLPNMIWTGSAVGWLYPNFSSGKKFQYRLLPNRLLLVGVSSDWLYSNLFQAEGPIFIKKLGSGLLIHGQRLACNVQFWFLEAFYLSPPTGWGVDKGQWPGLPQWNSWFPLVYLGFFRSLVSPKSWGRSSVPSFSKPLCEQG